MFQFSTAHWCERRIGQAGPEVWPSRTRVQNGKRLAAYGDFALAKTEGVLRSEWFESARYGRAGS